MGRSGQFPQASNPRLAQEVSKALITRLSKTESLVLYSKRYRGKLETFKLFKFLIFVPSLLFQLVPHLHVHLCPFAKLGSSPPPIPQDSSTQYATGLCHRMLLSLRT